MIHDLIGELRRLWPKFQTNPKYNMKMMYEDAAMKLSDDLGYDVNAYRIEKKWNNLVSTYKIVLNRINTYGLEAITRRYEYFEVR